MSLNGEILSKDRVIGIVKNGLLASFDGQWLPLYLLRTKDVEGWLRSRAIYFAGEFPVPTLDMVQRCAAQTGVDVSELTVAAACDFIMAGSDIIQAEIKRLLKGR